MHMLIHGDINACTHTHRYMSTHWLHATHTHTHRHRAETGYSTLHMAGNRLKRRA